jgi:hypothetical protein
MPSPQHPQGHPQSCGKRCRTASARRSRAAPSRNRKAPSDSALVRPRAPSAHRPPLIDQLQHYGSVGCSTCPGGPRPLRARDPCGCRGGEPARSAGPGLPRPVGARRMRSPPFTLRGLPSPLVSGNVALAALPARTASLSARRGSHPLAPLPRLAESAPRPQPFPRLVLPDAGGTAWTARLGGQLLDRKLCPGHTHVVTVRALPAPTTLPTPYRHPLTPLGLHALPSRACMQHLALS